MTLNLQMVPFITMAVFYCGDAVSDPKTVPIFPAIKTIKARFSRMTEQLREINFSFNIRDVGEVCTAVVKNT